VTNQTAIKNILLSDYPKLKSLGVAYDPITGGIYVSGTCSSCGGDPSYFMSVINAVTNSLVGRVASGRLPVIGFGSQVANVSNNTGGLGPGSDAIFVSSGRSSNLASPGVVTVIPTSNNTSCGQFPVGISPTGIIYVPSKGWVYVVNEGSNTVSVLPNGCPNYLPKLAHEQSG
jgi:DNA-binding beta-propeller fold protein YncE